MSTTGRPERGGSSRPRWPGLGASPGGGASVPAPGRSTAPLHLETLACTSPIPVQLTGYTSESDFPPDQDVDMLSVLEDATAGTNAVSDWRTAVLKGLAGATGSTRASFPKAFWRWFQTQPELVIAVFRHVPVEAGVEERLARATPRNLDEAAVERFVTDALSRGWLCLHGALLAAIVSTSDAVRRQVAVDADPSFFGGLRWALRHAKAAEYVECALETEDPRMPRLAGEAVAKEPRLLAEIDFKVINAQAIWREALTIDPETWRGPADPSVAFRSILDHLLSGGETDIALIERLADTPVADLGTYPRRREIWSRIGGDALKRLLARTAKGWLQEAASAGVPFVPEPELQIAILESEELEQTLDALIPDGGYGPVRIVAALNGYDEQRFLRFLERLLSRTALVATADAEAVGRLVLERRWEDATADLVRQYRSGRGDLRPALRACGDLIGFWDRFVLGIAPVSEGEKWKGLEEMAVQLYPGGPDDRELWERAGGANADLPTRDDGRSRWRRAVGEMRNGRGPTAPELLAAMMEDFNNNERIRHLAGDPVFHGGVPDAVQDE